MTGRRLAWALLAGMPVLLGSGCKRYEKPSAAHVSAAPLPAESPERLRAGPPEAGPERLPERELPVVNPYAEDRRAVQEGRRLYRWMNCEDCHGDGGGSIGPPLWDTQWRYGGRGIDIAESILLGRPNGMPAFAGHLPDDQVWKLVAYVQAMAPHEGPYNFGRK